MSLENKDPEVIIAVGLGANKGFWMVQLRDRHGQWAEMGHLQLMLARLKHGLPPIPIRGKYIGASNKIKGFARILVQGFSDKGFRDGVYHVPTNAMETIEGIIPEEALKRQGITPGQKLDSRGNPIISREWSQDDFLDYENTLIDEITPQDLELADATPTDEEKQIIEEQKANSPLAQLEPGAEGKMSKEELARIVESMPSEEVVPSKQVEPEEPLMKPQQSVEDVVREAGRKSFNRNAWKYFGKEHSNYRKISGEKNKKGEAARLRSELESKFPIFKLDEALKDKIESLKAEENPDTQRIERLRAARRLLNSKVMDGLKDGSESPTEDIPNKEYFENLLTDEEPGTLPDTTEPEIIDTTEAEKYEPSKLDKESQPASDDIIKEAIDDAMDGNAPTVDEVVEKAKGRKGGRSYGPSYEDIPDDDVDFKDGEEETPSIQTPETSEGDGGFTPPAKDGDLNLNIPPSETTSDPMKDPELTGETPPTVEEVKQAIEEVAKMSNEELDALAAGQDFTQDTGGFVPSSEQKRAIAAIVLAKQDTVMDALAGCGKTATSVAIARAMGRLRPDDGVLVLTFGNKNAADAKARLPRDNSDAMTTHKLARKSLTIQQKAATKINRAPKFSKLVYTPEYLALHLGTDDTPGPGRNIDSEDAAFLVDKIISNFCNSPGREISKDNVIKAFSDAFDMPTEDFMEGDGQKYKIDFDKWLGWANKYWDDISQDNPKLGYWDKDKKKFVGNRRIAISQDHVLKLWQLSNPDLSKIKVGTKRLPAKLVIIDEAQDTNETVVDILKNNKGNIQLAHVGDTNQNIFTWRGAVNALNDAKNSAGAVVNLTTSYRMPDSLTGPGNAFLNILGDNKRLVGNPNVDDSNFPGIVGDIDELPFGPQRAHLTRTNLAAAEAIVGFIDDNRKVAALSQLYKELTNNYYYIQWLRADFKDRTKTPQMPNGEPIKDSDFRGITTLKEFQKRAERDPKSVVGRWYTFSTYADNTGKTRYDRLGEVIEDLLVDKSDTGGAVDSNLDASIGSSGTVWISKAGRGLNYEVDDFGVLTLSGEATYKEYVNGSPLKDYLKNRGWKYNGTEQHWEFSTRDDDDRQSELDAIAAYIPNRLEANDVIADVTLSTAHRGKGLEWDYVSLGNDFADPNSEDKKIAKRALDEEETRIHYVSTTRAKKGLFLGSLEWAMNYSGRDGLEKFNTKYNRPADYGMDGWDYRDKMAEEVRGPGNEEDGGSKPEKLSSSLGSTGRNGKPFIEQNDQETFISQGRVSGPTTPPKNFLDGWQQIGSKGRQQYSKLIDGVRWEVTVNKDGSALLRNRSDSSVPSKKYDSIDELAKNFGQQRSAGVRNNRELSKSKLSKYDPTGKIAKLIDSGADGDTVIEELFKDPNFIADVQSNKGGVSSLIAALEKLNNGRSIQSKNSSRFAKPKNASTVITPTPHPGGPSRFWVDNPARQDDPKKRVEGIDVSGIPKTALASVSTAKGEDIIAALLAINPNATIKQDGSIVWARELSFTEPKTSKDFAGKKTFFELRIVKNQDDNFRVVATYTDLNTGMSETFYHYAPHKSLTSLLGVSGPQALLEKYFLRDWKANPKGKTPKDQMRNERYYGGIRGGFKAQRTGSFENILRDPSSDDTSLSLRTPTEEALLILGGREQRLNKSKAKDTSQLYNQMRKGIPSFWDALDKGDKLAAVNALVSYVADLPDTQEARDVAKRVILETLRQKFAYLDEREFTDQFKEIVDFIENKVLDDAGIALAPHRLKSGEIAQVGMKVRWPNNIDPNGDAVGVIDHKLRVEHDAAGNFAYSNYVSVRFSDDPDEQPRVITTEKLIRVPDNTPLEKGRKTVRNDQLDVERALKNGDVVDFDKGLIFDKKAYDDNGDIVPIMKFNTDAIDFSYIDYNKYEDQIIGSPQKGTSTKASDISVGDTLYDPNGGRFGRVISKKSGTNKKTGSAVTKFTFDNGDSKTFNDTDEIISSSPLKAPEPSALTTLGKRAADIGIGMGSDGKTAKTLSIDTTQRTPIKDSSDTAVKPTEEARKAKDEVLAIGDELRKKIDQRTLENLQSQGISTSNAPDLDTFFNDLESNRVEKENEKVSAKNALDLERAKGMSKFKSVPSNLATISNANQKAIFDKMNAEGLIKNGPNGPEVDRDELKKRLDAAGLPYLATSVKTGVLGSNAIHFHAYDVMNDRAATAAYKTLQSKFKLAAKNHKDAQVSERRAIQTIGAAQRQGYIDTMNDEGIELDNVSLSEFNGLLFSEEKNLPVRPEDTFLSKVGFEEAISLLPSSMIRGLISRARNENKSIFIMSGVPRAFVSEDIKGFHIHLSNRPGMSQKGDGGTTATAIHENTHVIAELIPNMPQLQHAFIYDKGVQNAGTPEEMLPNVLRLAELLGPGYSDKEKALAIKGLASPYMSKVYERGITPESSHSEVMTMAFEDALSLPGIASRGKGLKAKIKDKDGKKKVIDVNYDPNTDTYTDSKGNPVDNIVQVFGRAKSDGVDNDVRNLAFGTLFALADRSGAVAKANSSVTTPKPSGSAQKAMQKGSIGSDNEGVISSIIDKFSGSDGTLSRSEYSQLINFLQNELEGEEASKYTEKELNSLRSYLSKITGL